MTQFYESSRQAILVILLLSSLPFTASSACWNIELSGATVNVSDLWQIRNRISGEAVLLGESSGRSLTIPLERVDSLKVRSDETTGWLSGRRKAVDMEILLIDNQTITLVTEMNLYYQVGESRHAVRPEDIVSISRCVDDHAIDLSEPETTVTKQLSPILVMKNGDRLYGEIVSTEFYWQTSFAKIAFSPAEAKFINIDCDISTAGKLETRAGDLLKGSFANSSLLLHLTTGQILDVPTDQIRMIDFIGTQLSGQTARETCRNESQ